MAAQQGLEKAFELEGAGDSLIDFGEFSGGEFLPAGSDGSIVVEAAEEELDFGEGEAHVAGKTNKQDAMKGVGRVTALAAEALGWGEETHFFVIADGGGVEIGAAGELADFHSPP